MATAIEAVYEHGVLRPKEPLALEEGAEVEVIVISRETGAQVASETPDDLSALLEKCAVDTGIPDLAQQHDHYLYGTPKRDEHDAESVG